MEKEQTDKVPQDDKISSGGPSISGDFENVPEGDSFGEKVAYDSDASGLEIVAMQDVGIKDTFDDSAELDKSTWMRWVNKVSDFCLGISMYILYPAILTVILIDVIGRNFFHTPLSWAIEGSGLFLVGAIFLATPRVELDRDHILLDILYSNYSRKLKLICDMLTRAVCCVWMAAATVRSSVEIHTAYTLNESGADFKYPFWPMRVVMTCAFFILTITLLCNVILCFKALRKKEQS